MEFFKEQLNDVGASFAPQLSHMFALFWIYFIIIIKKDKNIVLM
jgi:hypothetical protein